MTAPGSVHKGSIGEPVKPPCPMCGSSSNVAKVSTIILNSSKVGTDGASDGSSSYPPALIRLLAQPVPPDKTFHQSYGLPLVLFAIGLLIGTYCATGFGSSLFRINRILNSGYRPGDAIASILALPGMPITALLAVVALGLILRAIWLGVAEDQRIWREHLAYHRAQLRWEYAYYCTRDDVAYLAEQQAVRSPERFSDLLWDGSPAVD